MIVAGLIRLITGVQARWKGIDPVRPDGSFPQRIYFANHSSNLDAPLIWAALPPVMRKMTRPVAAADYWDHGHIRRYFANHIFRCVLIPRHKVSARNNPLATIEPALDAGDSLILFPEGTRAMEDDAELGEFKPGLWHLAKKHPQVELVPVYLENLSRILPKGELILIPIQAAVTFGPPLHFDATEDKDAFLHRARHAIEQLAYPQS